MDEAKPPVKTFAEQRREIIANQRSLPQGTGTRQFLQGREKLRKEREEEEKRLREQPPQQP